MHDLLRRSAVGRGIPPLFRGAEPMSVRNTDSDVFAGNIVSQLPGGIAIVETNSVAAMGAKVKVVKVDGKAVGQPGYPL